MLAARVKAVDARAGEHALKLVIAGSLVRQFVEFGDASALDSSRRVKVNVGPQFYFFGLTEIGEKIERYAVIFDVEQFFQADIIILALEYSVAEIEAVAFGDRRQVVVFKLVLKSFRVRRNYDLAAGLFGVDRRRNYIRVALSYAAGRLDEGMRAGLKTMIDQRGHFSLAFPFFISAQFFRYYRIFIEK